MARPAVELSDALAGRARSIARHRERLDAAHGAGHLRSADLNIAYAGAFLTWCTALEKAIEQLFIGILMNRVSVSARVQPLVEIRSDRVAHAVVRGERRYVDWLPFDNTVRRAEAFFASGLPFSTLPRLHVKAFERTGKIRNAVAHDSAHAQRSFRKEFVDGQSLPASQRKAGGYLRGQHSGSQTRLDFLIAESLAAFAALCT